MPTSMSWPFHRRIPGPGGRSARQSRRRRDRQAAVHRPGSGAQRREERSPPGRRRSHLPRDPDKFDGTVDPQREFRQRGIPSGWRTRSSSMLRAARVVRALGEEPQHRLFDATPPRWRASTKTATASFPLRRGDIDTPTDGFADNTRLYLSRPFSSVRRDARDQRRAAGASLLAQPAGLGVERSAGGLSPAIPASAGRDADDR